MSETFETPRPRSRARSKPPGDGVDAAAPVQSGEALKARAEAVGRWAQYRAGEARTWATRQAGQAKALIERKPAPSVAIAAAAGLALGAAAGLLLGRLRPR